MDKNNAIYQAKNGAIELKIDSSTETIWASLKDITELFETDKSGISRHIKNIFKDCELEKNSVVAKNATTGSDGKTYQVAYYNLDMIISIGYRVNSKKATEFRKWATKTLKQHITSGYTINPNRIHHNYQEFIKAVDDIKLLANNNIASDDVLELVKSFANTWFNLEAFDENNLPNGGENKEQITLKTESLYKAIAEFKNNLITKKQATKLFAQEKNKDSLAGIFASVFQSAFGEEVYPSVEEKAAHLLYFIVKNHPFNDGNKRSGAFSFIWFLNKANFDFKDKITPETLTTLTLLIATSNPSEKDKLIGLVLLLLKKEK
jgi:death-on-curing family protein